MEKDWTERVQVLELLENPWSADSLWFWLMQYWFPSIINQETSVGLLFSTEIKEPNEPQIGRYGETIPSQQKGRGQCGPCEIRVKLTSWHSQHLKLPSTCPFRCTGTPSPFRRNALRSPSRRVSSAGNLDLGENGWKPEGPSGRVHGLAEHQWLVQAQGTVRNGLFGPSSGDPVTSQRSKPLQSPDIGSLKPTKDWNEILPISPGPERGIKQLNSSTEPRLMIKRLVSPLACLAYGV